MKNVDFNSDYSFGFEIETFSYISFHILRSDFSSCCWIVCFQIQILFFIVSEFWPCSGIGGMASTERAVGL